MIPGDVNASPKHQRRGWRNGKVAFADATGDPMLAGRHERLHAGGRIGGVVADISEVTAKTGRATYSGVAIADVVEYTPVGKAADVQEGSVEMSRNVNGNRGTVTLSGALDDTVRIGVHVDRATGGDHHGSSSATGFPSGPGSASLQGGVFVGGGDPVAATAGSFAMEGDTGRGPAASTVGVCAAAKTP